MIVNDDSTTAKQKAQEHENEFTPVLQLAFAGATAHKSNASLSSSRFWLREGFPTHWRLYPACWGPCTYLCTVFVKHCYCILLINKHTSPTMTVSRLLYILRLYLSGLVSYP